MYTITKPPLFPYNPTPPDIEYLRRIFLGLLETFPSYSQDFFKYYLCSKEGIKEHYTIFQFAIRKNEEINNELILRKSCENGNDTSFYSNKENIDHNSNIQPKEKPSNDLTLSIEKSLSCRNPVTMNDNVSNMVSGVFVVDRVKGNPQTERSNLEKQLFSSEERGEADDFCGFSQVNGSCVKDISDLDRESVVDVEKMAEEQRGSYLEGNNLYCEESISEVFKSRSFEARKA
eukprot:TRINITY_DN6887_c0_g1_i1.p1 TRINITY_DN6887_c0_g1~~TRINITY_DN6887_c0_g1_i1.p1  ORF type:complete len:232 (+),score=36.13 TRINITY_DN6887_c0_g1_i1:883-1578(+)